MLKWKRARIKVVSKLLDSGFYLRTIEIPAPPLAGRSLLFFTDLHIRGERTLNLFGCTPLRGWNAISDLKEFLIAETAALEPDYIAFGGDLVSASCMLDAAMDMLKEIPCGKKGRAAVYGNWDKRRRKWLPFRVYEDGFHNAGFQLLKNQRALFEKMEFFGLDDYKIGMPMLPHFSENKKIFRCLLSHNPDAAAEMPFKKLQNFNLILCGHTHGGQIRLPFYGALKTSSHYGKKFEYGAYQLEGGPLMFVSSGIGTTLFPLRINCPPEIVLFRFQ